MAASNLLQKAIRELKPLFLLKTIRRLLGQLVATPKITLFKISLMLCIICAHLGLLYLLYFYSPSKYSAVRYSREHTREQITQITFITRSPRKPLQTQNPIQPTVKTHQKDALEQSNGLQAEFIESKPQASLANGNANNTQKPLNLNLPDIAYDFSPKERDLLERPRNPIDYQTTQFNGSWKPSGNAVDSLKWKSKTFNFITGILGGNQRICTDEDRKNRLPDCVPDDYKPED